MNCRTDEIYDQDEYFCKFLEIHPILYRYNEDKYILKLQEKLCKEYKENKYSKTEIQNIYNTYKQKEIELNQKYYDTEKLMKLQLKIIKENIDKNVNNFIEDLIKEI